MHIKLYGKIILFMQPGLMIFHCQKFCYDKELVTQVSSSELCNLEILKNGKKEHVTCYETLFHDTIFFPEGGGQPYDTGSVNDIAVLKVIRRGNEAVHYVQAQLETGSQVQQVIDWTRRFDHMQQHSAQHLITAVADRQFSFPTTSWNLGDKISCIELETGKLSIDQLNELEDLVNREIRKALPVTVQEFQENDPKLTQVRSRGLPEDVKGPVRVITIEGIDSNMCCGTHVKNLSELQAIKLLYSEKGKSNKTLLYFVAGNRVLRYLGDCFLRDRAITGLLHSNPEDHVRLIEKSKKDLRQATKCLKDALQDLAVEVVRNARLESNNHEVFFHHRRDGNLEYLGAIVKAFDDNNIIKILTAGEDNGPGSLIIHGPQECVDKIALKVCEILDGKGGGKTRFTAKVNKLGKRKEMQSYVIQLLKKQT